MPSPRRLAGCVLVVTAAAGLVACGGGGGASADPEVARLEAAKTLTEARAGFQTTLGWAGEDAGPPAVPPPGSGLELVAYPSPAGDLAAYVTEDPGDGERRPAIVWITGGDNNSIGPVWGPPDPENDQGATGYRDAGIVMMFPSQRGGNHNPGRREGFLGEVDDVLAAAEWLRGRPHVDPDRVYLGGHSTGGTLAMLVAETDRAAEVFRAAFAFGPVADVRGYGGDFVYHTPEDDVAEAAVRGPGFWLESCRIPLWAIEGDGFIGNDVDLEDMAARPHPPNVHFVIVPGRDHFDVLHGANAAVADAILKDTGPRCDITLTAADLR